MKEFAASLRRWIAGRVPTGRLECREVFHDQEVTRSDLLGKCVIDLTFEDQRVHGSIDQQWGYHALWSQCAHKSGGVPIIMGSNTVRRSPLGA